MNDYKHNFVTLRNGTATAGLSNAAFKQTEESKAVAQSILCTGVFNSVCDSQDSPHQEFTKPYTPQQQEAATQLQMDNLRRLRFGAKRTFVAEQAVSAEVIRRIRDLLGARTAEPPSKSHFKHSLECRKAQGILPECQDWIRSSRYLLDLLHNLVWPVWRPLWKRKRLLFASSGCFAFFALVAFTFPLNGNSSFAGASSDSMALDTRPIQYSQLPPGQSGTNRCTDDTGGQCNVSEPLQRRQFGPDERKEIDGGIKQAQALQADGKQDKALAVYSSVLAKYPQHHELRVATILALLAIENYAAAKELCLAGMRNAKDQHEYQELFELLKKIPL